MPKRKKLPKTPDFEGMGINCENHEIQKARPLQSLAQTDLTLPEFKILDLYLARIDSHDQNKRTVILEKGELEKALGVTRILKDDLNKRLRHLFQVVEVKDKKKRKGFKLINLFEEADAEQDDDGLWQITLTCTTSAREYVFNIDNIGYLQYRLKNVINLTSRYSYVLFLYLLDNRFRKTWSVELADLRQLLGCTAESYRQYYRLNDLVLKKCKKELCEKTDIIFEYKPIKHGRSIGAVEFNIISAKEQAKAELRADGEFVGQTVLGEAPLAEQDYGSDELNAYAAACGFAFDADEIKMIKIALDEHTDCPKKSKERVEWLRALYNNLQIEELYKKQKNEKISSRIKYFLAIIKDAKPPKKEEQHETSYDLDAWADMAYNCNPNLFKNDKEDNT